MHDIRRVSLEENILDENDHIAEHINEHMSMHGVLVVNEMGAPGVGKTTAIKNIIKCMKRAKPIVIEGDIESDIDTAHLKSIGIEAHQINTFGACHLDAPMIEHQLSHMEFDLGPDERGILFIENIGNLVCPAEFSIGEHVKLLISTVTEGSDKPYKYPLAFEKADIILLSKVDLIPYLDFDEDFFMKGVRALNPNVPVIKVSGKTGEGYEEAARLLEEKAFALRPDEHHHHDHDHEHHHHDHEHHH